MPMGTSNRRSEPLYVIPMALALSFAAFAGGALGLVWHATGFGDPAPAEEAPTEASTDASR